MAEKITADEITFEQMSEEQAVQTFQKDGYFDYQKRRIRYQKLSSNSIWATTPATMFVAFYKGTPVGAVGFSRYKGFLLDAGVHVREEYRGRGLGSILIDKMIKEKGNKTLLVNINNPAIIGSFRRKGFSDMRIDEIPQELQEELEGLRYSDQVQKILTHSPPNWQEVLKKKKTKKDACYYKVKSRYKKWPSAYASGALVQCRKVGAANWGESTKKSWEDTIKGGDNFAREKKEGLHGWFSRRGGGGQKGWVSCQSCEDDKKGTKPCGRKDASKGTKQRCRPTCAACKTYKRRKGSP